MSNERLYDYSDLPEEHYMVCRGSYALGSACGRCQRCLDELKKSYDELLKVAIPVVEYWENRGVGINTLSFRIQSLRDVIKERRVDK